MVNDPVSATNEALTPEEYLAERRLLIEARQRGYQRADQMVIGGATGALLLSITFLNNIAPGPTAENPALLLTGWVALLACLGFALAAQYATGRTFDCEIARLDATTHNEPPPPNPWAKANVLCTFSSFLLVVAGIGLLAGFAYVNAPFNKG